MPPHPPSPILSTRNGDSRRACATAVARVRTAKTASRCLCRQPLNMRTVKRDKIRAVTTKIQILTPSIFNHLGAHADQFPNHRPRRRCLAIWHTGTSSNSKANCDPLGAAPCRPARLEAATVRWSNFFKKRRFWFRSVVNSL
jgi:hypothetical protein